MRKLCLCLVLTGTAALAQHSVPATSAADGLHRLHACNESYLAGKFDSRRAGTARRAEVAKGQHPFASVLACADSRVAPELLFSQGLGDLFVVRVAGSVPDGAVLGSLEYAAEH